MSERPPENPVNRIGDAINWGKHWRDYALSLERRLLEKRTEEKFYLEYEASGQTTSYEEWLERELAEARSTDNLYGLKGRLHASEEEGKNLRWHISDHRSQLAAAEARNKNK